MFHKFEVLAEMWNVTGNNWWKFSFNEIGEYTVEMMKFIIQDTSGYCSPRHRYSLQKYDIIRNQPFFLLIEEEENIKN